MSATDEPTTAVDDATFMENVREALGNGHDVVCAECGVGVSPRWAGHPLARLLAVR